MKSNDIPIDWQSAEGLAVRRELTAIQVSGLMMEHAPAGNWGEIAAQLRDWWNKGGIDQQDGLLSALYCTIWLDMWVDAQADMLAADAAELIRQGLTQEQVTQLVRLWTERQRRQ
jgi:hypothetical protein